MKKVRYATGALAALGAMPALALATPPAGAATHPAAAASQAAARTGKTVSLTAARPCNARVASSPGGTFSAAIVYSRDIGCIGGVAGVLKNHTNAGWWMRVRSYVGGHFSSHFNSRPIVSNGNEVFTSAPRTMSVSMVCEAMVRSTSSHVVQFGPKCERTGF